MIEAGPSRLPLRIGSSDLLDLLAFLDAAGLVALISVNASGLARILLTVGFAFFVPGRAIVDNWPALARWSQISTSIVLSLVAVGLLATVILWAHAWHPLLLFQVEAWLSIVGISAGVARRHDISTQWAHFSARRHHEHEGVAETTPTWVGLMDLDGEAPITGLDGPLQSDDEAARLLVRMHQAPLGFVHVSARPMDTLIERTRIEADTALAVAIRGHIACDAVADDPVTSKEWFARAACPLRFPQGKFAGLTIAVCTRDRPEFLTECLRSLQHVTERRIQILVVDNAPTNDATRRVVSAFSEHDPRIRYRCEQTPGRPHARNHALANAKYKLVAFIDDDVSVDPGWPAALLAGFALDPAAVCVTGLVASRKVETLGERHDQAMIPQEGAFAPRRFDLAKHRYAYPLYSCDVGMFGSGANFAVRAMAVKRIGGFDAGIGEEIPGERGEDLDLFLRLILAGGRICYLPAALVWRQNRDGALRFRQQHLRDGTVAMELSDAALGPGEALSN